MLLLHPLPEWHRSSTTQPLLQPAVDLMQIPADTARPELHAARKFPTFFEAQYVLRRIGHDQTKLFFRDDSWQFVFDGRTLSRLAERKRIVLSRSGAMPLTVRVSLLGHFIALRRTSRKIALWLFGRQSPCRERAAKLFCECQADVSSNPIR